MINYNNLLNSPDKEPILLQCPLLRRSYNTTCVKCDYNSTCGYDITLCVKCVRPKDNNWEAYENCDERWAPGCNWYKQRVEIKTCWIAAKRIFRKAQLPTSIEALIIRFITDGMGTSRHIENSLIQNCIPKITYCSATDLVAIPQRVIERIQYYKEYEAWIKFKTERNKYYNFILGCMKKKFDSEKPALVIIKFLFEANHPVTDLNNYIIEESGYDIMQNDIFNATFFDILGETSLW